MLCPLRLLHPEFSSLGGIGIILCTMHVVVIYRIIPFISDVILMISWKSSFQTLPCGLVSFHNTGILVFLRELVLSLATDFL